MEMVLGPRFTGEFCDFLGLYTFFYRFWYVFVVSLFCEYAVYLFHVVFLE